MNSESEGQSRKTHSTQMEQRNSKDTWETFMQLNIDGLPSQFPDVTEFFGREIEKLGITMLALQDTRRTITSGTALARQVNNGRNAETHRKTSDPKDAEQWTWRHEYRRRAPRAAWRAMAAGRPRRGRIALSWCGAWGQRAMQRKRVRPRRRRPERGLLPRRIGALLTRNCARWRDLYSSLKAHSSRICLLFSTRIESCLTGALLTRNCAHARSLYTTQSS